MTRTIQIIIVMLTLLLFANLAAAQSTCAVPVEYYLTDISGEPLNTEIDLELHFYLSDDTEELAVDCRIERDVSVTDGWMRLILNACELPPEDSSGCGTSTLLELFSASEDSGDTLHVGMRVGDDPDELTPRIAIGAVPFALRAVQATHAETAEDASTLGGIAADGFLREGDPIDATTLSGLTAEEVITMTGDGSDESAGWSSGGGGGGCVTLYGQAACPSGFTEALSGETSIIGTFHSSGASGSHACIDRSELGDTEGNSNYADNYIYEMGQDGDYQAVEADFPCVICCTGGSGGTVSSMNGLRLHGVTSTVRLGNEGRAQMDADCNTEFPGTRICRMSDLMAIYPAPVPEAESRVLISQSSGFQASNGYGSTYFPDGSRTEDRHFTFNCTDYTQENSLFSAFTSTSGEQTLITAEGNFRNAACNESDSYPTACCGP